MTTKTAGTETERDPIREFVDEYEFRGDAGDYSPTEAEREMLEDFAHGLLVEFGIMIGSQPPPRPRKITGRSAMRVDDVTRPE